MLIRVIRIFLEIQEAIDRLIIPDRNRPYNAWGDHCYQTLNQGPSEPRAGAFTYPTRAWKDFSLYTNGELSALCASAIRWAGFKEVINDSSIKTLARRQCPLPANADVAEGRNQIYIEKRIIL
jgi:hypothetical protein